MAEGITLPVLIVAKDGRVVFANESAGKLTGYSPEELVGHGVPLGDLCAAYEAGRYILATLAEIRDTVYVDLDFKRKGGSVFMASTSFSPFVHEESRYLFVTLRDVTDRRVQEKKTRQDEERYRKLLQERNRLEAELKQSSKLAFMGELAAGIAHEINNPLGIILGFVQDILEEISENHPLFEPIRIIEQETARCADVVRELLDFARLKPPQRTNVDILEVLEDSVFLLTPQIKKNKLKVGKSYHQNIPYVEVDPGLIQQVFLNVLLNAIQAMPFGGNLKLGIGLEAFSKGGGNQCWVCVTISDTGHGIPNKIFGKIFDPFFTTKGGKGTGLGLPVCQRIMDDHLGRIQVQSQEGIGTTCRICLPV